MHPSSLENMQRCYERYLPLSPRAHAETVKVLDMGGANVNGSYADIFSDSRFIYSAADIQQSEGVDIVLADPNRIPLADASMDVVISGQAFEHVEQFWRVFDEMARVVHPEGMIFLIVPSGGPIHRFPVDCYRFFPDAMHALARSAGIPLVDVWMDDKGPWNDVVGVFSHQPPEDRAITKERTLPVSSYARTYTRVQSEKLAPSEGADDPARSDRPYLDVLARVQARLEPRVYLEIGVDQGSSLALARGVAIGVDPHPLPDLRVVAGQKLIRETSDRFFETEAAGMLSAARPDLVFLNGLPLFESALKDFINAERWALPTTLVVVSNIFPNSPMEADRTPQGALWTGDVWKLHEALIANRPDLLLLPIDVEPGGMLLVAGLDPGNRILSRRYNPIVRKAQGAGLEPGSGRLQRKGGLSAADPKVDALLALLRGARDSEPLSRGHPVLRQMLKGIA